MHAIYILHLRSVVFSISNSKIFHPSFSKDFNSKISASGSKVVKMIVSD